MELKRVRTLEDRDIYREKMGESKLEERGRMTEREKIEKERKRERRKIHQM